MDIEEIQELSVESVVDILRANGATEASAELIELDIAVGAPIVNKDGSINLLKYLSWLLKQARGRK